MNVIGHTATNRYATNSSMCRFLSFLALVCVPAIMVMPMTALAWGNTGHEAVAYIAWQQMGKTARTQALALLKLVPQLTSPSGTMVDGYDQWVTALPKGISPDDQNLYLFMRAATWADAIKHIGFQDSDNPPTGVAVEKPMGFPDQKSHGYWHFVDKGFTSDGSTVLATPTPNAAVQIQELRKDLAAEANANLKAYELVWLEHLVGDIHQPLHAVIRLVANKSDLGGNDVKITLSQQLTAAFLASLPKGVKGSAPRVLHAFWDDLPGVTSDPALALKPAADFAKGLAAASANDLKDSEPTNWAAKSFQLATQDAYVTPIGRGNAAAGGVGFVMTKDYYTKALADAKAQVALAGGRLATMLNTLWPEPTPEAGKK